MANVGEACSAQLPCVHVPSSSVFVTLLRLFVLVSVTVCTTFGDTSVVSLLASTYLIVRVITFVSTSSSFACGYFTTTSVFSVVGVTATDDTLVLSGVPYLANVGEACSAQFAVLHVPSITSLVFRFTLFTRLIVAV